MNHEEFMDLHASCVAALGAYYLEAEKTTQMLAGCTVEPLTFTRRLNLMSQEIAEKQAHAIYLSAKSSLYQAARLGYGSSN